ncbi:hypothetical protein Ciccas_012941, partial [Cichlidogyrus casuarinus]
MHLEKIAQQAMSKYGTQLMIDDEKLGEKPSGQADFFEEHSALAKNMGSDFKVEELLEPTPEYMEPALDAYKKAAVPKKSRAVKKGGMGASKVTADFSEIEAAMQRVELEKKIMKTKKADEAARDASPDRMQSLRMTYQEIKDDVKKGERNDPGMSESKASQAERLGMRKSGGRENRRIAHSALTGMTTIEQANDSSAFPSCNTSILYDKRQDKEECNSFLDCIGDDESFAGGKKNFLPGHRSNNFDDFFVAEGTTTRPKTKVEPQTIDRKPPQESNPDDNLRKFANSKAISSDQFFGNDRDNYSGSVVERFGNQSAISSDAYFGRQSNANSSSMSAYQPELSEIRDSVRSGMVKVAGKLSNYASNLMNNVQ